MRALLAVLICTFFIGCRTNETPEAQVDDLKIMGTVKSKLAGDMGLKTVTNIDVNSVNGIVTLSGTVDSAAAKEKAEAIAKAVPQVSKVVNNLQVVVKPTSTSWMRRRPSLAGRPSVRLGRGGSQAFPVMA